MIVFQSSTSALVANGCERVLRAAPEDGNVPAGRQGLNPEGEGVGLRGLLRVTQCRMRSTYRSMGTRTEVQNRRRGAHTLITISQSTALPMTTTFFTRCMA